MKTPTITTNRLLLRTIVSSDLKNIFKGLSDPLVTKHYGVSFDSLESTKEQMIWFKEDKQVWWAVCDIHSKEFYGAGGLNDIDFVKGTAEIGFWLLLKHWGKGIMKEALPLIANYGLTSLQLKRIEGIVESQNTNCKNAMSKLDFELEKTIEKYEQKNGEWISVDFYVKTKM